MTPDINCYWVGAGPNFCDRSCLLITASHQRDRGREGRSMQLVFSVSVGF